MARLSIKYRAEVLFKEHQAFATWKAAEAVSWMREGMPIMAWLELTFTQRAEVLRRVMSAKARQEALAGIPLRFVLPCACGCGMGKPVGTSRPAVWFVDGHEPKKIKKEKNND